MKTLVLAFCLSFTLAVLAKPLTITCTVLDPDGKPVAGAKVALDIFQPEHTEETTTGADGRFTVSVELPKSGNRLLGRVVIYQPGLAVGNGLLTKDGSTFQLRPPSQVSGLVVDPQGKPVADAVVRMNTIIFGNFINILWIPDSLHDTFTVHTDAGGRWTIKDVPAEGKADVDLIDPRFVRERIRAPLDGGDVPVLKARPGAVITGLARFEDGRPAAGMHVFCNGLEGHNTWAEATTGTDGRYQLTGLTSGPINIMFDDRKGDWVAAAQQNVPAVEGRETAAGDLVVTAGVFIEGDVTVKETGKPIPEVYIGSHGPHRPRSSGAISSATTDDKGHYRLRVSPGQCYIYLSSPPPDYIAPTGGIDLEVKPGETKTQNFRLSTGIVLSGRVIDTDGNPVVDETLGLALQVGDQSGWPHYARIGAGGDLTFSGLKKGIGRLYIDYTEFPCAWELVGPTEINVPLGGPLTVTLRRSPLRTLRGRVVTPAGQPVSGVTVTITKSIFYGRTGTSQQLEPVSGADGVFTLADIAPTMQLAFVGAQKNGYKYISGGKVTNGAEPAITDIVLAPLNVKVNGNVTDAEGKPVAGALVISAEAGMAALATTDAVGAFTLTDQPAGAITLLAAKERSFVAMKLKPGEPAALKLAPAPPQPPQDIARGTQLLNGLLQESAGKNYYAHDFLPVELMPYDRKRAMELLPATGGQMAQYALAEAITRNAGTVSKEEIDQCLEQIAQWNEPSMQLEAYARIGAALAERDPALAKELYGLAAPLAGAGRDLSGKAFGYSSLAVLALKLKLNEANGWIEQAMQIVSGMEDDQGLGAAVAEALAEVDPQAAVKVAKSLPVKERSAQMALARVIEVIARTDPQQAGRLLADMPKGEDWSARFSYGYAAKYVITALAKDDPAGMLALARTITDTEHRLPAITAVATYLPKDEAVQVLREAAIAVPADEENLEPFIKLAAAASGIDKALGDELFTEAMQRVQEKKTRVTTLAYALRTTNPAASRLLLESVIRQQTAKPDVMNPEWSLLPVALAMAPLDFDRAWEIARAIPEGEDANARFDAQRKLIQYLLAPVAVRATIPLDRWSASDGWQPGQPTQW